MSLSGFRTPQEPPRQNANLQWERFTVPIGENLIGRMATTGFQIANVQIDNLSGSWIQVNPGGFFVPPYTLGWATNLIPTANSVDILFTDGPSGLSVSSQNGSPINVAIYNEALGNNVGSPYVASVIENQYFALTEVATPLGSGGASVFTIIPAIVNSRIRLLELTVAYNYEAVASANYNFDTPVTVGLFYTAVSLPFISISPSLPFAYMSFGSNGIQIPVNTDLQAQINSMWVDTLVTISGIYTDV